MNNNDNIYFAKKDPEELIPILENRSTEWFQTLIRNNYLDKIKKSWSYYHGAFLGTEGHQVSFTGEQGELVTFPVNHYRNIAQHILIMVTSNRPAFQARATNSDAKSQIQTILANGILDYYMREERLERYLKSTVEYGVCMGSGYIKMGWNSEIGDTYDYDEEDNIRTKTGNVEFCNLSAFDVVFDSTKNSYDQQTWVICRSFKNKYDLAAKYPELEEKILNLQTKTELYKYQSIGTVLDETCDVPVYEFFHKKTEAIPEGRYVLYLDDNIALVDTPMPYRKLPVYRLVPSDFLGTSFGYTNMFDLLPLQEAVNSLYSTVLTNQNAFGVQNIYVPRGADIAVDTLNGALNIIEGNPHVGPPVPLQLTQTPPEIFNFIQQIISDMETLSGVNSVARGNPESSLKSGNALALVQTQALQFVSGLQESYIQLIEDVGTGLLELLQDYAHAPRIAAIVGKTNITEIKTFTGEDISNVSRVIVDVGNALSNTAPGRAEIANNLLQMKPEQFTVSQYLQVMQTGQLNIMTESSTDEMVFIKSENESLVSNNLAVNAIATDKHKLHINEHKSVLGDVELRLDGELIQRTLDHIEQHLNLLRETDPGLLAMLDQQPLGPIGGSPVSVETAQQGAAPETEGEPAPMMSPEAQQIAPMGPLPTPATPPEGFGPLVASEIPLAR